MSTTAGRAVGVAITAGIVAVAAILQAQPYTASVLAVSDWLQLALISAASSGALSAAVRASGEGRFFWLGVAASTALWGAGQARYMQTGSALSPELDDLQTLLFLAPAIPLLSVLALRPEIARADRGRLALDVGIVSVLVAFLWLYIGLIHPISGDVPAYQRWYAASAWLIAGSVMFAYLMRLRSALPPWREVCGRLGPAIVVWFVGEPVLSGIVAEHVYRPGLLDLPWMLPFAWIALVAWQWRPAGTIVPERGHRWADSWRGAILAQLAVAAPPLVHYSLSLSQGLDADLSRARTMTTLVASVLIGVLFLARQLQVVTAFERSERERAERRRASEERFTKAFHGVPLATVLVAARDGRVIDANERCLEALGLPRDAAIGGMPQALQALLAAPGTARDASGVASDRGRPRRLARADGQVIDVLVWVRAIDVAGQPCVLVLFEDQRETERLERQLLRVQKTDSVGRLAGSVAHDFNNLLTVIRGSAQFARDHLGSPAALREDLDHVLTAATKAAALTSQLLAYGRSEAGAAPALDVRTALEGAERTLRQLSGASVEVEYRLERPGLAVRLDPEAFDRVLINLVVNARDAMPGGGRVTIAADRVVLDGPDAAARGVVAGPFVALAVADSGEGIAPETLPHVFEPFFTTKAPGAGSGLGLATVLQTVREAGGSIEVTSPPGRGTTVTVWLPEASEEWLPVPGPPIVVSGAPDETVLLVEDEDAVRILMRSVLEQRGYRVIEAPGGREALILAADAPRIDLLLTDVIMPGRHGPELAAEVKAIRPAVRVLYASGYAADALGGPGGVPGAFLQKPFKPETLAAKVREVLDGFGT